MLLTNLISFSFLLSISFSRLRTLTFASRVNSFFDKIIFKESRKNACQILKITESVANLLLEISIILR